MCSLVLLLSLVVAGPVAGRQCTGGSGNVQTPRDDVTAFCAELVGNALVIDVHVAEFHDPSQDAQWRTAQAVIRLYTVGDRHDLAFGAFHGQYPGAPFDYLEDSPCEGATDWSSTDRRYTMVYPVEGCFDLSRGLQVNLQVFAGGGGESDTAPPITLLTLQPEPTPPPPPPPPAGPPPPPPADPGASVQVVRLSGPTRIETAAAVVAANYDRAHETCNPDHSAIGGSAPGDDRVTYLPCALVIARADEPADTYAAGAFAASLDIPLLLSYPDLLPATPIAYIPRPAPRRVIVVGGTSAISPAVEAQLAGLASEEVVRLAGPTRFATAVAVQEQRVAAGARMVLVDGRNFAVALVGAALAVNRFGSVLLTDGARIPEETRAAIDAAPENHQVFLLGDAAIGADANDPVSNDRTWGVEAFPGHDPVQLAADVAAEAAQGSSRAARVVVASADSFADSLTAPTAQSGLLLLTDPEDLSPAVDAYVRQWPVEVVTIVGGPAAVSDGVAAQLLAAVRGEPRPAPGTPFPG
ncbi:cell wall-binding repeat-containing protein [Euzebya pacifica]|uniref:cell wall-binding repeat-containing protein n=1 Tax=Euzebya pacifica TaxID=1608957 RepID=UPI0030F6987A